MSKGKVHLGLQFHVSEGLESIMAERHDKVTATKAESSETHISSRQGKQIVTVYPAGLRNLRPAPCDVLPQLGHSF